MSFPAWQPSQNGLASGVIGVGSGRSASMRLLSRDGVMTRPLRLYARAGKVSTKGAARRSDRGLARGDRDALAGEVLGRVAAEVDREGGDVVRGGHALERRALDEAPAHVLDRHPAHLGLPGDDAVDAIAL